MNLPNQLTCMRVILVFVFMAVIWIPIFSLPVTLTLALAIFVIASLTDFFDGHIARKYNLVTNFGKFMDPLADKMLVTVAMIAIIDLGEVLPAGVLPAWIVVIILLREFAISGIRLVAANQNRVIAANKLGKLKTVTQMFMIIFFLMPVPFPSLTILAQILAYLALFLTIASGATYIWQNKQVLIEK